MQLPCIEVSQLAPSTSFYAAVLQPLGLRYLTLESAASGPDFATFGCSQGPVLQLRQAARPAVLRVSSFRISAPSAAAIQAFYMQGMEANPVSNFPVEHSADHSTIFDLDGNLMQAMYTGLVCRPEMITSQFTLILNPQQETHNRQVFDSGTYTADSSGAESMDVGIGTEDVPKSQVCTGERSDSTQAKTEDADTSCGGMSTVLSALMGVAVGAAAGAAVTYGVMSARTSENPPNEIDPRQRSPAHGGQASDTAGASAIWVDRDQQRPVPFRSHRIKFQEGHPSTLKKPSTRPATSVHESGVLQSRNKDVEVDVQEGNGRQLAKIPRDMELSPVKSRSRISALMPARNALSTRRLALPAPDDSSPGARTNVIEDPSSEKEHDTFVSAHSHVSSSPDTLRRASQSGCGPTRAAASSASKRDHSKQPANKRDAHQRSALDKSFSSKRSFKPRSEEAVSLEARSAAPLTESPQCSSKTNPPRGTVEDFDKRSHASAGETGLSAGRKSGEDKRSRASATEILLPSSRVGTSESFDTRSHASTGKMVLSVSRNSSGEDNRSRVSQKKARGIPLPSSRAGTSEFFDTESHASARKPNPFTTTRRNNSGEDKRSRVSARDLPLPSTSRVGNSEFFDTRTHASSRKADLSASRDNNSDDKQSGVSARDIPLPSSRVGTCEFFDTVSRVSTRKPHSSAICKRVGGAEEARSHTSARNVPLPASCVDCSSKVADRNSHVSARNIPLPASGVGTDYYHGSLSHLSARNIPLPGSHVGSSRANWDDDSGSIAPSDSISCIGSK